MYAFTAFALLWLLGSETERLWRSWNAHGSILVEPLVIATALAAATAAMLWFSVKSFYSERSSRNWRLFCLGIVGLWSLGMFALFVLTHRARGMRLFYEAFDRPDTKIQITAVAYQAFVWVGMLAMAAMFARRWYLAGGFRAGTET